MKTCLPHKNSTSRRFLAALLLYPLIIGFVPRATADLSVRSVGGSIVSVHFSDPVDNVTATDRANYEIFSKANSSTGSTVTNAVLLPDNQTVALYLDQPVGEFFAVAVTNVLDTLSNNIADTATGYLGDWSGSGIGSTNDPAPVGEVVNTFRDTLQVTASGSGIGGTNDHGHFVYDQVTGDFEVIADITRLDFSDESAVACLMARDSLSPGSRSMSIGFTPLVPGLGTNRLVLLARTNSSDNSTSFGSPPQLNSLGWLRMTRTNNTFAVYYGTNGPNWVQCGAVTSAFNATLDVGLAVASHVNNETTTAEATSFGIAGTRAGTGVVPPVTASVVSNNLVVKWPRTPRDFTVQLTDRLGGNPAGSSNAPPVWSYMLLPVFDTSLTGTNVFMPKPGRYMTIPMDFFPNNSMFVRLTQVERVIPDPLGVTPGLILSVAAGNMVANNPGSSLGGYTVNTAGAIIVPLTNYLTCSPLTNYTFTTENSTNLRTVMIVKRATNIFGVATSINVATNAGIGNAGIAKISLYGVATNYTAIIAATNGYTPTTCNPLRLRIDYK